ncbi:MAG: helix-turn-helix domain-containing protein [Eubacterium sp.]|nr:helix-turn-helix domain-containing protein [Eubacterium sp.]
MNQWVSALARTVRETRKGKHLSQEALAERIGVCKRTIIDIENNTGNPKFEVLCKLVKELDLPVHKVFYPETTENLALQNILIEEIKSCSETEMNVILSVLKGVRHALREENV